VAIHTIVMNRAKNISDEPRSFSKNMTSRENPHASITGPRSRGSGKAKGPTLKVAIESTSRLRTRYAAKEMARAILANSPGWKLTGPRATQILAPLMVRPTPGTSGSSSRPTPTTMSVYGVSRSRMRRTKSRVSTKPRMPRAVQVACKAARSLSRRAIQT